MATTEPGHLKAPCQHCAGSIEFPIHGVGLQIDCPHCGLKTTLRRLPTAAPPSVPASASGHGNKPSRRGRSMLVVASVAGVLLLLVGGLMAFFQWRQGSESTSGPVATTAGSRGSTGSGSDEKSLRSARPAGVKRASGEPGGGVSDEPPAASLPPKSSTDLHAGGVTLEKAPGSSLVYAVGSLTNASPHVRYDLNVHLAMADASGQAVGSARDHRPTLEPREVWRFRALVLDSRARSGIVTNITEEP